MKENEAFSKELSLEEKEECFDIDENSKIKSLNI